MTRRPSLQLIVGTPQAKRGLPKDTQDAIDTMAAVLRAQYRALIAEGFTPSQALSIVKEQMR